MRYFLQTLSRSSATPRPSQKRRGQISRLWLLLFCCSGLTATLLPPLFSSSEQAGSAIAQNANPSGAGQNNAFVPEFVLPNPPAQAPVYRPRSEVAIAAANPTTPANSTAAAGTPATNEYILEFNRSPVVGNRLRLQGVYSEARLGFTRPRDWNLRSVKALIRFQHSPALLANRSNLTVRVNGTSVGSVPLNRKQAQVGQLLVNIPPNLIQDFNEITLVAQQNNSATCSDPQDATLWTEVLPDSKLLFSYQPRPVALDFSRYPYPFFDDLSLEPNRIAYLPPSQMSDAWMTAAARFQAGLGRLAEFRPIETRLVTGLNQAQSNERLVVIGTPDEQPALKALKLPMAIAGNEVLDGTRNALPPDVGVLMLTTTQDGSTPVLVATGNGPEGVAKAVQFLVQPQNRQIGTGQAILVSNLTEMPSPSLRQWPKHLPEQNAFQLKDLKVGNNQPFADTTVRGSSAPPVEFDFRALPDDRFNRGSSMTLRYSYGPQLNPRTSAVEVLLDGVVIGGKRLTAPDGANRETLKVNLPENLITPTSKLQVAFRLNPREPEVCGRTTDQQLWGTVHSDSNFNLSRDSSVQLPDLKLLQVGYPFAAPQDLSGTAIVVPSTPSSQDLLTLLEFSTRLGRLSQADTIRLDVYTPGSLPEPVRRNRHLVGIGARDRFPLPEAFQTSGFRLKEVFSRQSPHGQIQTLADAEGVVQQSLSPWNSERVLLALSGQTESGLNKVRDVLQKDTLFFQLQQDTVLINSHQTNPAEFDPRAYSLKFLQQSEPQQINKASMLNRSSWFLQENWFVLPTGIVTVSLVLYGIVQLYLKRIAAPGDAK